MELIRIGISQIVSLQNRIEELQRLEGEGHEKFVLHCQQITEMLDQSIKPEREIKRMKLEACKMKQSVNDVTVFVPRAESPLKSIFQGLASQALQAVIRELSSRGSTCKNKDMR
jgi:hypothetical protein